MSHAAHTASALPHATTGLTAGKFLLLAARMGGRHAERLREVFLATGGANWLLLAPDQEFKIAFAILAGIFVNRHPIKPFQQFHGSNG